MGKVVEINSFRRKRLRSFAEVVTECTDELLTDWGRHAKNNRLNDFFTSSVVYAEEGINYLQDLNAVADIENKLGIEISITSPNSGKHSHMGWRVTSRIGSNTLICPDMPFETYARCFNILLYQKVRRALLLEGFNV